MKKILPIVLLTLLASCDNITLPNAKYELGQKVLLKTGETAVIIHVYPMSLKYTVRVALIKKITEGLLGTSTTDVGKFVVNEFEIEGLVK